MAQETLKITITADNKDAVNNIQQTITATNNLGNAFKQLPNTSNQATNALTNLSRVAQDAPYGFMGIANNLNPLLESFQRLQKEAGSSGSALKAMAQGLMGPAGIGLALGAVSSIIVAFGPKISAFISGTKQATEEEKKFAESLNNAKASALSHGLQLQSYLKIASDVTIADDKRVQALQYVKNELGKVNKNYADSIKTVQDATEAVRLYTEALVQQAVISKYIDRIAELTIKQAEAQKELTKSTQDYNNVLNKTNKTGLVNQYAYGAEGIRAYNNTLVDLSKTAKDKAAKNVSDLGNQITSLNSEVDKTIQLNALNPFGKLTTNANQLKTVTGKIVADLTKISYAGLPQMNGANVPQVVNPILPTQAPQNLPAGGIQPAQSLVDAQALMEATRQFEALDQAMQLTDELTGVLSSGFNTFFEALNSGKNIGEALAETFKQIVVQLIEMVAKTLIFKAILAAIGGGTPALGGIDLGAASFGQGGGLMGEFLLKGSDLVLATTRSQQNLNLRRGK